MIDNNKAELQLEIVSSECHSISPEWCIQDDIELGLLVRTLQQHFLLAQLHSEPVSLLLCLPSECRSHLEKTVSGESYLYRYAR